MRPTTLCLPVIGKPVQKILLGMKKTGFGRGKYNGFGGKIDIGESVEAAAVREMSEECGLVVTQSNLKFAGFLEFVFPAEPELNHTVHIFLVDTWEGQPQETEEMLPVWFTADSIPYESMWADDIYWLPKVLSGSSVRGQVVFCEDNEKIASVSITCQQV